MRLYRQCLQQVQKKLSFVPKGKEVSSREVEQLHKFIGSSERLLVMTGAGLSTESGIPDYRSEGVGLYARTDRRPMSFQDFIKSHHNRQRYWARNYVGWPAFSSFQPNKAHKALSEWEQKGFLKWLVTQNVDALHTKAGSKNVTELHGCSHRVVCLHCPETLNRRELQEIFKEINPEFRETTVEIAPDGDVQLTEDQVKGFKVPDCPNCGGILKPDVIFFGDNVPIPKVNQVYGFVDECDSILVAGSSLQVYSGFRFVKRASDQGKQIAILNIGPTRADSLVILKIEGRCGEVLSSVNLDS